MKITKKITLFFILFFFCISCSDNNDKSNYPAPTGTWEVVIYEGHDNKGQAFPVDGMLRQLTFKSDGTGTSLMGASYENEDKFTWLMDGEMLSLKSANGNIEVYQIVEYSEQIIKLLQKNGNNNGTISINFIKK